MHFSHPELKKYEAGLSQMLASAGVDSAQIANPVFRLMAMLDHFKFAEFDADGSMPREGEIDWSAKSQELAEVIEHLIAPEQRASLRAWCQDSDGMNTSALAFRDWLEARIGQSLKPQQAVRGNRR